jgi:hypothetical protein
MSDPGGLEPLDREAIDYDRLWADYMQSLVDTLRGFSSGLDQLGLHAFVPSEDPAVSLRNLLDAAAAVGRAALTVRFGPASRPRIEVEALRALASGYGHARLLATETELLVAVEGLHPAAEVAPAVVSAPVARTPIAPAAAAPTERVDCYAAALSNPTRSHAGQLVANAAFIDVTAAADGATLYLQVDPGRHVVVAAGFAGEPAALLERFCAVITDLPLLEAAHHGVIHLETALRAPGARPVAGVITPRAAHARFALPATLIRQALASYRVRTGFAETTNHHDAGPGPAWRAASDRERAARIAAVAGDATLVAIEHDVRLVFALPATLDGEARQRRLWQLEGLIRAAIDPRLEVHAEERRDRNKLRRLGSRKESEGA